MQVHSQLPGILLQCYDKDCCCIRRYLCSNKFKWFRLWSIL